jgi:hypothetical protein
VNGLTETQTPKIYNEPMNKINQKHTHWAYWVSGTLLSLATIGAAPLDIQQYGAMGIVTLLFYWGTLSAERGQILASSHA